MKKQHQNLRGSILVFSLLVLAILLSATLSAAGIVVTGKNSSRATEKSALAFQIAEGAAENVLKRVYKNQDATLSQLASNLYASGTSSNLPQCQSGGIVSGRLPEASGTYEVAFFDNSGTPLACGGSGYSTYAEWRQKLVRIVASGSYAGSTRAVDVTIKPPACVDPTVDDADGNTYDTVAIGTQCWLQQSMRVGTRINTSTAQANNGTVEKYCYNNSNGNCTASHPNEPDGGLYTWDEAMQYTTTSGARGICPDDWHIPTDTEVYELIRFLDPSAPNSTGWIGTDAGTKLKANGTSGFEGNLAGIITASGSSVSLNNDGWFWSSSERDPSNGGSLGLRTSEARANKGPNNKSQAFSVRCIHD